MNIIVNTKIIGFCQIINYKEIFDIINSMNVIAIRNCSCREIKNNCNSLKESCFCFNDYALKALKYDNSYRIISKLETLKIILQAKKEGLVLLSSNMLDELYQMCICCKCCCDTLKYANEMNPKIASSFSSTYQAKINESCIKCNLCINICPVNAIENYKINLNKCIGCGLCETVCKNNSIELHKKQNIDKLKELRNVINTYRWRNKN